MREFTINKNDANQRLDKFIQKTIKGIPTSLMYKSIRTKKIKVNRKRAELNQILCQGDTVQMFLSEELFSDKVTETGSQQNSTHRCVLMRAAGDLSRYLAKTLL